MSKFDSLDDPGFIAVMGEIRRWTRGLAQPSTEPSNPSPSSSRPIPASNNPPDGQDADQGALADPTHCTPMYYAIILNKVEEVEMLLNAGVPANRPCYRASFPLSFAGQSGNLEIVKLLVKFGADVNAGAEKPLFAAATKGHVEIVRFLLESGADPDAPKPNRSWTALHTALVTSNPEIATILIDAGADVNAVSETGATPLMVAVKWGYTEIVERLLAEGARTDPVNPQGFSALRLAQVEGKADIFRILIQSGATN